AIIAPDHVEKAVACLYCSKEIGPIRLIRDSEFCSDRHRKQYQDRLRKALIQVDEPETAPPRMASFLGRVPPQSGQPQLVMAAGGAAAAWFQLRQPALQ